MTTAVGVDGGASSPPTQTGENGYGCDWHPSVATNAKMATLLVSELKTRLGWWYTEGPAAGADPLDITRRDRPLPGDAVGRLCRMNEKRLPPTRDRFADVVLERIVGKPLAALTKELPPRESRTRPGPAEPGATSRQPERPPAATTRLPRGFRSLHAEAPSGS